MRSLITTHVLDIAAGHPATGIDVVLEARTDRGFEKLGAGTTDDDGRIASLLPQQHELRPGTYRLTFDVGPYLRASGGSCFYDRIPIEFRIDAPSEHYHVPLLLSPHGYSTYRGS
ncbi:MAG: hydroxyisourate hydrolase [Thermoanaerobaculia bacterium]|nr:hydroxyisourate hydrolase [Thermoanaerobaculia bacterium]